MVAAAKLKHEQRRMDNGLPFIKPVQNLFERLPREEKPGPITYLAVTSDKGLCGGVNSAVNKQIKVGVLDEEAKGNSAKIVVVGSKGVAGMKLLLADRFLCTFEECSKGRWSFATASMIMERLIAQAPSRLKVVGNRFRNMVAYDTVAAQTVTKVEASA